ncbi:cytochrome C oxidase, cbb3-type, subunit III family protein, partial [Vibrio parahaemolyticus 10296]
MACSPAATHLK